MAWVKDASAEIPTWAESINTPEEQLMAVERRTHPSDHQGDYVTPVFYGGDDIRAAVGNTRPYLNEIKGIYWADGKSGTWRRESRTWSQPALVNVFGHLQFPLDLCAVEHASHFPQAANTRPWKLNSQQSPPGQARGGQEGSTGLHWQAWPPSPRDQAGVGANFP